MKGLTVGLLFLGSLALYTIERNLSYEKTHRIDMNGDVKEDIVNEIGYKSLFSRYEVLIDQGNGTFSRDTSFSKKDVTSKLNP